MIPRRADDHVPWEAPDTPEAHAIVDANAMALFRISG
jgi:hypothetical protein